jgi:hypothetical protein
MVDHAEQFFSRVTNAELDGKIAVPNGGDVRGAADGGKLRSVIRVGLPSAAGSTMYGSAQLGVAGQLAGCCAGAGGRV